MINYTISIPRYDDTVHLRTKKFFEVKKKMMSSQVSKVDEIDRQIIRLIQKDPDMTHTEIAEKVNRSQPTIGLRIRKLEEAGVLKFQAGMNMKSSDLYFAKIEFQARHPQKVFSMVKKCPFMINVFRLSGTKNFMILLACRNIKNIDGIVNAHFRDNPDVYDVTMGLITGVLEDFVLPVNLDFDSCECYAKDLCPIQDS